MLLRVIPIFLPINVVIFRELKKMYTAYIIRKNITRLCFTG